MKDKLRIVFVLFLLELMGYMLLNWLLVVRIGIFHFYYQPMRKISILILTLCILLNQQAISTQAQISLGVHSVSKMRARKIKNQKFALGDKSFLFNQLSCTSERMFSGFVELDGRVGVDLFRKGAIEFDYGSGQIIYTED